MENMTDKNINDRLIGILKDKNDKIVEGLGKKHKSIKKKGKDIDSKKVFYKQLSDKTPSVELLNWELAQEIDFSDMRKSWRNQYRENIFKWTPLDVLLYIKKRYYDMSNTVWGYRINAGLYVFIHNIHDKLLDNYGHCDMLVMRDYINYIFDHRIYQILKKCNGKFLIKSLGYDEYVRSFCKIYDYRSSFRTAMSSMDNKEEDNKKEDNDKHILLKKNEMRNLYLLSQENFVCNYGLIVAVFWLICYHHLSEKNSIQAIKFICEKIKKDGRLNNVIESTIKFSPYPVNMEFLELKGLIESIIDKDLLLRITYSDNNVIKNNSDFFEDLKW